MSDPRSSLGRLLANFVLFSILFFICLFLFLLVYVGLYYLLERTGASQGASVMAKVCLAAFFCGSMGILASFLFADALGLNVVVTVRHWLYGGLAISAAIILSTAVSFLPRESGWRWVGTTGTIVLSGLAIFFFWNLRRKKT